jgi:hypothetical protein
MKSSTVLRKAPDETALCGGCYSSTDLFPQRLPEKRRRRLGPLSRNKPPRLRDRHGRESVDGEGRMWPIAEGRVPAASHMKADAKHVF